MSVASMLTEITELARAPLAPPGACRPLIQEKPLNTPPVVAAGGVTVKVMSSCVVPWFAGTTVTPAACAPFRNCCARAGFASSLIGWTTETVSGFGSGAMGEPFIVPLQKLSAQAEPDIVASSSMPATPGRLTHFPIISTLREGCGPYILHTRRLPVPANR